ncbi:hypothetical protein K8F61_18565 [Microbacterium resistens]|uniref:Tape measure protein n=1 Tax=Microbacterium resistens TaxID=156977 RepID=A0ABY3RR98_9MICO|nr:hypothetical protein [Microbacterium resistens]UGS26589.1 hypothetical protein K8F61_18565 [Microbacterium resistens]
MARNTVIVSVLGDTRDLQNKLGGAEGAFGKFAKAAAAGAAVAVAAVGAVGVKAVRSASELEQSMGGMGAVFKDNGAQMEKWANGAASSVGLAKSEYASLATVLGSQLKNMGVSTDELGGQTNKLIGLGADLAAQFGGPTSDAVGAISSLLRGERDPIERYGVSINEVAVKAKMAEMGLSGLTGEAEKGAKLQATLALLYAQTADAQGAFARESTTLAGSQQRLAAGTENLYATLGMSLLPAVTAVTAALGEFVSRIYNSDAFDAFTGNLTEASNTFADFVFGILNGTQSLDFGALFSGLLPAVINGIQAAADWLSGGGLVAIFEALNTGRETLLGVALQVFGALVEALPLIIPPLIESLTGLVLQTVEFLVAALPQILDGAVILFTGLVDAIPKILPVLLDAIVKLLPKLVTAILSMLPKILDAAVKLFTALVESIPVILPLLLRAIVDLLPRLIESILSMLPKILESAVRLFTALVESIPIILPLLLRAIVDLLPKIVMSVLEMLPTLLQAAIELFTGLVTAIPRIVPDLVRAIFDIAPHLVWSVLEMVPRLVQAGMDLIGGLVQGLGNAAWEVGSMLLDIASSAVDDFLSFFGIHSPSRLFEGFGVNIDQGLAKGLAGGMRHVTRAVDDLNGAVEGGFDPSLDLPSIGARRGGTGAGYGGQRVYEINIHTLAPSVEVGRAVVAAIREYEAAEAGVMM